MPLDFLEIRNEIQALADQAPNQAARLRTSQKEAARRLAQYANDLQYLQEKAQRAFQMAPHFHVALPTNEALNSAIPLPPGEPEVTLLAADGSQINPDRHMGTDYCLVNTGTIQMKPGSGQAPETHIESRLYYGEEVLSLQEEIVALMRDVRERQILSEQARSVSGPVITLTDGTLELWSHGVSPSREKEFKQQYFQALTELHQRGAIVAGYVDRPRTTLLVHLLEIAPNNVQLKDAVDNHPLLGLLDTNVLAAVLKPGERSAIFGLLSRHSLDFRNEFALHFFYLNVSTREEKPELVKIEIPAWVAENKERVDTLHAALVAQCQVMSATPYPYVLARADEIAVVKMKDKQKVADMIANALWSLGLDVPGRSPKQQGKDAAR